MDDELRSRLDQEDWDEHLERLIVFADRLIKQSFWRGEHSRLAPGGKEAVDFAMESIVDVYTGADTGVRTWDPLKTPNLRSHLFGVVRSKISNAFNAAENKDIRINDDMPEPSPAESPDDTFLWELFDDLADEPDLQKVIEAVVDGHDKRSEIADALGLAPSEVSNLRKRLGRRITAYRARMNK